MPALPLDAPQTTIAQAVYLYLDDALKFGILTTPPVLNRPGLQDFMDDSKITQEIRDQTKDTFLLALATTIKAIQPLISATSPTPVQAFNNAPSTSIASATYADLPGATLTFSQSAPSQKVVVTFDMSSWAAATGSLQIRLVYDGVNQTEYLFFFNTTSEHHTQVYSWVVNGSASPGNKTVKIQWRTPGAITVNMDGNDHFSLIAR